MRQHASPRAVPGPEKQSPCPAPLILTLELDTESFHFFDELRRQHFPARRNQIPAHLTLFHKLPGEEEGPIRARLHSLCEPHAPLPLTVDDVILLGRGVAYRVTSEALMRLHRELSSCWPDFLTPQDRQGFRPHVVIQNKVAVSEAQVLHRKLAQSFRPFTATGTGLHLWRYLGGPWADAQLLPFGSLRSVATRSIGE